MFGRVLDLFVDIRELPGVTRLVIVHLAVVSNDEAGLTIRGLVTP